MRELLQNTSLDLKYILWIQRKNWIHTHGAIEQILHQVLIEDTLTKTNVESLKKIIKKMWKRKFRAMDAQ